MIAMYLNTLMAIVVVITAIAVVASVALTATMVIAWVLHIDLP